MRFREAATIQKARHIEIEALKKLEKYKWHDINQHSGYFAGLVCKNSFSANTALLINKQCGIWMHRPEGTKERL